MVLIIEIQIGPSALFPIRMVRHHNRINPFPAPGFRMAPLLAVGTVRRLPTLPPSPLVALHGSPASSKCEEKFSV